MAEGTDSPVVARLFTQGCHRNASVILLLQNMFLRGKFNTDISRKAQYLALFRSSSDRKQIVIVGERIFGSFVSSFGSFVSLSEDDVRALITSSKVTSCSMDPIPTTLLLKCIDTLLPVITKVINVSLESGYFPRDWK